MAVTTIGAAGAAPAPVRNKALIQDVAECVLSFPENYDPTSYFVSGPETFTDPQRITMDDGREFVVSLGATQDIVGWTCLLSGWEPDQTRPNFWRKTGGDGTSFRGTDIAQTALGLTAAEARRLFSPAWTPGASRGTTLSVQTASALLDIADGGKL